MKIILLAMLALSATGCFAAQYDAINEQAEYRMQSLDAQCKQRMTDWCVMQYALVQRQRENDLGDLQSRRQGFADAMRHAGESFKQN